jgi:probable phosphoglycerate mutase
VLGTVGRIVSSPLQRARETAEALSAQLGGLPVEIDERWIELDYGKWDELPVRGVTAEQWAAWRADPAFVPPGGESLVQLQGRVGEACDDLARVDLARDDLAPEGTAREGSSGLDGGGGDVAVFTHVSPIKAAIAWALGVGPGISWRMHVAQASISRLRLTGPVPALISFNEVTHLVGLEVVAAP